MPSGQGKDDDHAKPAFVVTDRRAGAAGDDASASSGQKPAAPLPEPEDLPGEARETSAGPLPPLDFHTFILSLASAALYHLGELDGPDGTPSEPDLPLAQYNIDVIAMLQTKTRGNLTAPEAAFIEGLLYDLRLRFVEKNKPGPAAR